MNAADEEVAFVSLCNTRNIAVGIQRTKGTQNTKEMPWSNPSRRIVVRLCHYSPSQSPTSGVAPAGPYPNTTSAGPEEFAFRRK